MITPKQFQNGQCVIINGEIVVVVATQHKRTAQRKAEVKVKFKNLKTGNMFEENLTPDDTFEEAFIEKKGLQYMYKDGDEFHFMDHVTCEQYALSRELVGESANFLKENEDVLVKFFEGNPIGVELPVYVELKIVYTEPGLKGDTARGGTKPATLETGAVVKVPLFVEDGTVIKIDTRTGEYGGRV